ncbi:hypothetical protein ABNP05_10200, partial [Campylobacter coli]
LQNERNFDYQKERANIADQQWQMNYNQRARQYAMQNALRQQAINARQQKDEILAGQAILNLPSYTKSNPEMRATTKRFKIF